NDNQQIEWSKIKRDGKTSYFMNFKRLPNLEKEIMELLKKDMQGFEFDTEVITKNERYYKAIIERNGEKIEIGYSIHMRNGAVELFIKGPNKAFQ
ncbi:MAG: hypothetical protein K2F99_00020, partial [Muribaculaceae bacterium]|nr:hypothetical protein [Muribaculaceae bacterium]